jgi:hypothetical protein
VEIDRFFGIDLPSFIEGGHFTEADYFSYNSGAVQFHFEGNLTYALDIYGEQLSIVVLPSSPESDDFTKIYKLSKLSLVPPSLKECIGKICRSGSHLDS